MDVTTKHFWDKQISRFVWLRGVIAGFAILSFLPNYIPFSQLEILKAVHATIIGWNELSKIVGEVIGKIPFFPSLSPSMVNTILVASTIIGPAWFSIYSETGIRQHPNEFLIKVTAILLGALLGVLLFAFFVENERRQYAVIFWGGNFIFLVFALMYMPSYRSGFIFVVGFLFVFELLYLVNNPYIERSVKNFTCRYDHSDTQNC